MTEDNPYLKKAEVEEDETKPSVPRRMWEGWKRIARKIGDFNARVILTLFYFIPLFPFAVLVKLFTDPLGIKGKEHIGWHTKEDKEDLTPLEKAERQF